MSCGRFIFIVMRFDMLLLSKDLKSCLSFLVLSFWLVQNLSSLTKRFPASGNDNLTYQAFERSSL